MHDLLVCPVCGYKNRADAPQCAKCGIAVIGESSVTSTLDMAPNQLASFGLYTTAIHRHGLLNDGVVFYVAGATKPLIIRGKREILLGRRVDDTPSPVVDLTRFQAHLLGVSRRHAQVTVGEGGGFVQDLGSANGTWLNEKRLNPHDSYIVNSGDQLRLSQLILFVYFASLSTRQTITLEDHYSGEPPDIANSVTPYVQAIIDIQQIVDEILGRQGQPCIEAINVDTQTSLAHVDLEGAMDAVQLVRDNVIPWKQAHREQIAGIKAIWAAGKMDADDRTLAATFKRALAELASDMLSQVVVDAGAGGGGSFAARLSPLLQTLVLSSLEIVINPR